MTWQPAPPEDEPKLLYSVIEHRARIERARKLIEQTELFDELGLGQLAAASRLVAQDALELATAYGWAVQASFARKTQVDRLLAIIAGAAYDQCRRSTR